MAVADSVIFDVNVVDGVSTIVVPAVPGKKVRVWRAMLNFSGPDGEKGSMAWSVGGSPSYFYVSAGDRSILGYEALAWASGEVGAPLTLSIDADISINGTIRAEHVV